ncbi:integrase catalytic domain-containing protein [Trichonephila clavipes]|uniref:Integrase catalytic domain-containing protein n=1 Tax=Trichonephila clavipes TaxID=2585209 RepID=A0A8X6RMR7_TRICX|nr:integrase catalytic domain-containing protein [Trichonephila clavipes]
MDAETATVLRGRAKAALTRTINFIDKNEQTFDKNDIRNKLEKLELTYTEFDKADAALPIESSEMEEFETKYYETKAKLQNILENLSVRTYVYNDNSDVFENVSNMKSSNFKLPKINIERFSGDYKNWPSFKDLYVSLVHDNMCLSNIQKFQYLRGLLLSEPANIIKHIPITETAYNEAWEKLLARYDKKKQIIFSLIKTFMEQPSFNDTNSHNLRNIADTSDEVIRGLKSIDTKAESRDVWLIYILLQKVDPKTRQEWAQFSNNIDFPTFEAFIEFLNNRCTYLELYNRNSTEFLAQFSEHSSHDARVEFSKDSNESSKVLGLFWNSSNDTFGFQPSLELTPPLTKRRILSESSKIFDPLGLLSPCTVFMKIFYQKLWLTKTDWDSPIPQQLTEDWLRFQKAFNAINYLTVPRWVILTADNIVELHGFADASSLAYAAAIYCRQKHNGKIKTDSKIVLSWLSGHPRQWKTFVANRTSEIIEVLPTKHWRHVPSKENPADIASRGIDPKCLPDCKLWWQGPPWLRLETSSWPKAESSCDEASDEVKAEQKSVSIFNLFTHTSNDVIHGLFEHYSSLTKVIRIFAYCQRFIKNCKKIASQGSSISSSHINTTSLTFSETKTAEETIIRWVQGFYFQEEIRSIKKQISLPPKSPLRSLHPFIDEHGLVRVGGRLQNSQLRFNSKHPIILPSQHSISELLIKEQHIAHLHAGPTLLAHVLRQSHWIVGSRKLINKCIRKCLKCNKFKTSTTTPQLMGNLPKHRVTLERPFFSCGIDYAGPVLIKCNKGRGTKSTKGYIALFVCLATKAVHIEAVGDLTTDSFIAALRRFSARRGAPRHIYSDNGTNFVGARRKLDEIRKLWLSLPTNEAISYYLSKSSIDWHFIPPSSPHFGGIWESGIRSVKFHLKRVLGETILTFEELTTLLTQIEGLLNSRPLSYVNDSDIECISTLTPSHFLTGDVLLSVPEELPSSSNHRDRWELLQNIKRGFWKKWSSEFISSLQPRKKWQDAQPNLKEDDIVLIKEEGPPGTWPKARVLQVHPGNDGLVRVATVKTQDSVFKRPVHKLHKLPIYPN